MKDGLLLHATASTVSGLVATSTSIEEFLFPAHGTAIIAICSPADVIKSRIMARKNGSIAELMKRSLRDEGPSFLFKGWTPAFVRLGPNTVLLFVFLEVSGYRPSSVLFC